MKVAWGYSPRGPGSAVFRCVGGNSVSWTGFLSHPWSGGLEPAKSGGVRSLSLLKGKVQDTVPSKTSDSVGVGWALDATAEVFPGCCVGLGSPESPA